MRGEQARRGVGGGGGGNASVVPPLAGTGVIVEIMRGQTFSGG